VECGIMAQEKGNQAFMRVNFDTTGINTNKLV
jgi:hypothetical protein